MQVSKQTCVKWLSFTLEQGILEEINLNQTLEELVHIWVNQRNEPAPVRLAHVEATWCLSLHEQ